MPNYFDSSLVISLLIQDTNASKAASMWEDSSQSRVSSILLEGECLTVLRRLFQQHRRQLPKDWLKNAEETFEQMLKQINLKTLDASVIKVLRAEKSLAQCRSLDALHLATLLYLQKFSDEKITLLSFDEDMKRLSKKLKIPVA
ncbi:MAG: type II toxin-antitoxin system VapC family toxin [Deltaproteobacteria bacterium]|nr:type II toxin-antitoxin system VapC family toxin [Deltaproteobacteria bacterium]